MFTYKTENRLDSVDITDIKENEAHGWDDISMRMIKLYSKPFQFPLKLLCRSSLEKGNKKSNIVPLLKKIKV